MIDVGRPCGAGNNVEMGDQVSLLNGQTAVVTGGAQGLGFAIAEQFVAEGARVVLGDVNLAATQAAAEKLGAGTALAVACDVTRADEVDTLIGAAVEHFGGQQRRDHS